MDRWRGVIKVPLHPLSKSCYSVAASLCLSATSGTLLVPSANAIFFCGDRVTGTGNEVIQRLSDLQNIAEILVSKIGGLLNAWVIEASDFNGPFAVYKDFIPSVNQWGEPKLYCPDGYPASGAIVSLLSSSLEEVKSNILRQEVFSSHGISTWHFTQPRMMIFGFSKGGTVLNQIVTEFGLSDIELSKDEVIDENKSTMNDETHMIPVTKEAFWNSISEIHYVDVGLNSSGAYITDAIVIEKLSKHLTRLDQGIRFILHGTPRQWRDSRRSWICNEKDKLVDLLQSDAQPSGGKFQVCEKFYFADRPPDLQMHFEIIEKLNVS